MTPIIPAATTCVLRERSGQLEVLLLKRNPVLKFAPGYWVFPGGRIDDDELEEEETLAVAALRAARREAMEETQLDLRDATLQQYYHWTTPAGGPRRFGTWFFHTLIDDGQQVEIDDGEIVDHVWLTPAEALEAQRKGELAMLPPTYISLQRMAVAESYGQLVSEFERTGVIQVRPVVYVAEGRFYSMYEGDAGYIHRDPQLDGPVHRLTADFKFRKYQFHYTEDCPEPPITGGLIF